LGIGGAWSDRLHGRTAVSTNGFVLSTKTFVPPGTAGSPTIGRSIIVRMESGTYAMFDTSEGAFTIRLFEKEAPNTVANFVGLAEGTKEWRDPETGKTRTEPYYD